MNWSTVVVAGPVAATSGEGRVNWLTLAVVAALVALPVGLGVGWLIASKMQARSREHEQHGTSTLRVRSVAGFVAAAFVLVAAVGWLLLSLLSSSEFPEIQMGIMVVGAIATLLTVLFIVAAGFGAMDLTDAKQPLGLPEGSIRAVIALVLIMVFIILAYTHFESSA